MKLLQRFLALICLVLLFIFCISNTDPMTVRFLSWETTGLPVFLLLIFAFLTGMVLALLWQSIRSVSRPSGKQERSSRKVGKEIKEEAKKSESTVEAHVVESDVTSNEPETTKIQGEK